MNLFLETALSYAEMGYSVIPITAGEKAPPLIKWEQYQKEKANQKQIESWWQKWQTANVGIVTGEISGICVVDHDRYKPTYNEEIALQYFPDNIITATATSPRNGLHLYFEWPGESIPGNPDMGGLGSIDFRCDGNYIVAPPSVNGDGNPYSWIMDLRTTPLMRLPDAYKNKIISTVYRRDKGGRDNSVTSVTDRDIWADGTRDENLFHVAYCLTQTKNDEEYIRQTLRAIISSWGERDEEWIDVKIKSAMDRDGRVERNIQAMVDAWIRDTERDWNVSMCDKELGIVTTRDMAARRQALKRRKDITIEKVGTKDGWWRRIDTDIVFMDFDEPEGIEYPVLLPFELSSLVKICQGNIILVAGEYNAGKSAFALNVLVNNKNRVPIRYMSSEMKVGELKDRFKSFGLRKDEYWPDDKCKYVELRNNITALLLPDGLNIIDYLEFPEGDYTRGGEYMRQIHDKLTTGVAIVCNQQKEGQRLPRSGDLILEKPRLAVTLRKLQTENEDIVGYAEILKAKNVTIGKMDGKKLKYQITDNGSRFKTLINWGWWRM
jgi:hypothetical protein